MLTPDQLEAAARRLCKLRGIDPDAELTATLSNGEVIVLSIPPWNDALREIRARLQMDEALAGVERE